MKSINGWLSCCAVLGCIGISSQFGIANSSLAQPAVEPLPSISAQQSETTQAEFARHFDELEIEGSIAIYDLEHDVLHQYGGDRNTTPFLPASTFKILNSLIALETGAIADDRSVLTWDGVERDIPAWNRDLNLRSAFQASAVWFYQVLARRIGYERMDRWVRNVGYGNQTIGNAEDIDTFWLTGELRITPLQQIGFLQRLYGNDLPFADNTIATVKDIAIVEHTPEYTIRAKTGWAAATNIGWYVGYVEQNGSVYFFATNIDIETEADLEARKDVTRRCLETLGLL